MTFKKLFQLAKDNDVTIIFRHNPVRQQNEIALFRTVDGHTYAREFGEPEVELKHVPEAYLLHRLEQEIKVLGDTSISKPLSVVPHSAKQANI